VDCAHELCDAFIARPWTGHSRNDDFTAPRRKARLLQATASTAAAAAPVGYCGRREAPDLKIEVNAL